MNDFDSILKHQALLASQRCNFDTWWQDIAYRVLPAQAQFTTQSEQGEKRSERLFDANAVTANERFASVMDDLLTPRTQAWHMLAAEDDEVGKSQAVKAYFEEVNKILFAMRYRPKANFASQKHQGYLGIGAFGNSCMFIDEEFSREYSGPRYRQLHMAEVVWAENHQGVIDTVYRRFRWAALKIVKRFGESACPRNVLEAARSDNPWKEFELIHCVRPNDERMEGRADYRGMPWASYYGLVEGKHMVERRGYTSWPFALGRYTLAPNESYGRSPAMAAWSSIMTINEEKKTVLRAGQKEVEPPLLLTEDGVLDAFNLRPGALNYGGMSDQGTALVQPLQIKANVPLGVELMTLEKQQIEDSFLVTIFKILAEHPQMTATQVLEIVQQKATLLAPTMGRQQSEDLGPLIERELDIAAKAGLLPPPPDELIEAGGAYKIEYRSPMARAMRAQDGVAIVRTLEVLPVAAAIDGNASLVVDVPGAMRELAEINGMPAKFVRDEKTLKRMAQQKAEDEQAVAATAAAPELSQAALNAAKAQQIRNAPAA